MSPLPPSFAPAHGARLAYVAAGAGDPPVVLLHAGIADRRMWPEQVAVLAPRHRVVAYDLRGFGESLPPPGAFSHRRDLEALLAHLEIDRPVLVGASMGGRVALDYTLTHPGQVTGLVLAGTVPGGFDRSAYPPAAELAAVAAALAASDLDLAAELEVRMWLDGPHRTAAALPADLRAAVRAMNRLALAHEAEGGAVEEPPPPALARVGELALPVLVVHGELDRPDVVAGCRALAAGIAGARLHAIAGTAHLPSLEAAPAFNALLLDFLAGLGKGGSRALAAPEQDLPGR